MDPHTIDQVLEFTVHELPAPGNASLAAYTATTSLQSYLDQLASGAL